MAASILGYGVYLPYYRIKREDIGKAWGGGGRGENAVAFVNEDVITMAVEAAQNAVEHAGVDPASLGAIYVGTNSAPFVEQSSGGVIAMTLGVSPEADLIDFTASPRASLAALKACSDAIVAGRIKTGLVIGTDDRQPSTGSDLELAFGAGACALVMGQGQGVAELHDVFTFSTAFRDTWRADGDSVVRVFEPRYTREYGYAQHITQAASGLMKRANAKITDFQHVVIQQPDDRMPRNVARTLGASPQQLETSLVFPQIGDTGAASVLLGLAAALDRAKAGERVLALSYGSGVSDALAWKVTGSRPQKRPLGVYLKSKEYVDYTTYLKFRGVLADTSNPPAKMGLPPMSPLMTREGPELLRLIGGKCAKCGYVNYPPSERRICIRCGNTQFHTVVLPRRGKIHTFCISYYLPAGFEEATLPVIVADLEDGTRHRALGTEMKPEEVKIDKEVELVVRRLATEDNTNLYGNVFRFPRGATV